MITDNKGSLDGWIRNPTFAGQIFSDDPLSHISTGRCCPRLDTCVNSKCFAYKNVFTHFNILAVFLKKQNKKTPYLWTSE